MSRGGGTQQIQLPRVEGLSRLGLGVLHVGTMPKPPENLVFKPSSENPCRKKDTALVTEYRPMEGFYTAGSKSRAGLLRALVDFLGALTCHLSRFTLRCVRPQ